MTGNDFDRILNGQVFSNDPHKDSLRNKLFGEKVSLNPDELSMVVGGISETYSLLENWHPYPNEIDKLNKK